MLDEGAIRSALRTVSGGAAGAQSDMFAESTTISVVECGGEGPTDVQFRARRGIGLGATVGDRVRYVHASGVSEDDLAALATALRSGDMPRGPGPCRPADDEAGALSSAGLPEVAAEAVAQLGRESGVSGSASLRAVRQHVIVADSDGRLVHDQREYWSIRIDAMARDGRKLRRSRQLFGAASLGELVRDGRHLRLAAEAAGAALARLEAVAVPSGQMPVVFAPGRPGALIHEIVGHGLEADHAAHPAAAYHGLVGEAVGAACLTVVDDPAPAGQPAIYAVDDEGVAARPTVLIENGRLRTYLYDRRTALAQGTASNGHGRRLDYSHPALPRTSATYVAPGSFGADEILADTPDGLLVRSVAGGDTDMGSGRFNLRVEEAYMVESGRVTAPVTGATVSGAAVDVLRSIDRVGDDLEFANLCFVCNKLEQFPVLITVGQPTMRVSKLQVWGDGA